MNNYTLEMKLALQALVESGYSVSYVAYNPTTVATNPLTALLAAGFAVDGSESSPMLNESILTKRL